MSEIVRDLTGRVGVRAFFPTGAFLGASQWWIRSFLDDLTDACDRHLRCYGFAPVETRIQPALHRADSELLVVGEPNPVEGWDADGAPVGTVTP